MKGASRIPGRSAPKRSRQTTAAAEAPLSSSFGGGGAVPKSAEGWEVSHAVRSGTVPAPAPLPLATGRLSISSIAACRREIRARAAFGV